MARNQKRSNKPKRQPQLYQPYDTALKSLMGEEIAEILPNLLPEAEYVSEENIEIDRTTLKADLVYNITYKGVPSILNMELQTEADNDMLIRMIWYHIGLYDKHRLPVISMILYPFETSLPEIPFAETVADELLMLFPCRVVALWKLEAHTYIEERIVVMYTFLPAMHGANASLLLQAIDEMKQHYTKPQLGDHLARFRTILQRSQTISEQDRQIVEAQLQTYDSLMESSTFFQQKKAEAEVQGAQKMIVALVEARFLALTEVAQQRVTLIRSTEMLNQLVKLVATAPDEATTRWLLETFATS